MSFKFHTEIATFSLNNMQLYVGTLRNANGETANGVSLLFATQGGEGELSGTYDYVFSIDEAIQLSDFLNRMLDHQLPVSFTFPRTTTNTLFIDGRFEWTVSRFKRKWHHGGGFVGGVDTVSGCIITKHSAERLQQCIRELFEIPD